MKLKIVEPKTARLLQKIGFNIRDYHQKFYNKNNQLVKTLSYEELDEFFPVNEHRDEHSCEAPTQALAQMWFREKHNLNITPINFVGRNIENKFKPFRIQGLIKGKEFSVEVEGNTYEEALEAGLLKACEIVKQNK